MDGSAMGSPHTDLWNRYKLIDGCHTSIIINLIIFYLLHT